MIDLVDRYGGEIEADLLAVYQVDLLDFFRGRHPWSRLLRLLDQLPRTSRFHAALATDEHRAAQLRDHPDHTPSGEAARPELTAWTQEAELLAHIADLLAHLRADYAQVNSKNHRRKNPAPVPRPQTALERLRRRGETHQHREITAALLNTEDTT